MKYYIVVFLFFTITLYSQTYKVDMAGVSNQYPLQIGVINGDVVITSTENKDKGSNQDAVHLVNVTQNKSIKFANNYRQNNPRLSYSNNSILFSHREISSITNEDISQIGVFDISLNIQQFQKLNFNIDTEIYSALQSYNSNYFAGAISYKGFMSKFSGQNSSPVSFSISKTGSRYFTLTNVLESNNSLISCYFDTGFMGLMKLDTNLKIVGHKDYNFNNEVKFTKRLIKTSENYFVLSDNYDFSYSQILSTSIHKFDTILNHIIENKFSINNYSVYIRSIIPYKDKICAVGYYTDKTKVKSFVVEFDASFNLKHVTSINDLEVINDICIDRNNYIYLVGTSNNIGDNGDVYYIKTNDIYNICNSVDITNITQITPKNDITNINSDALITNILNNNSYKDPSFIYIPTKYSEICKPISNNIDFQLLKVDYKSPCSNDSVSIEIVPSSSNINVVWFDGSLLKKRYFSKNGNYKVTLTIPGVKDTTFDVNINSIYKGSTSGNLTFYPDTLLFSNSHIDKLTCKNFTLTNVGSDTVTLNELTYLKKLNFSTPNSIFPITLYPKESRDLEVCFYGNKFKTNYTDSIRFDNCNNPRFLTLLADIPEDTLSFATRCMLKFNEAAPSKSIVMAKQQLNDLIQELQRDYKLSNLLGLEIFDINAILPNQLVYLESISVRLRILVVE